MTMKWMRFIYKVKRETPERVIEISEGVKINTTYEDKIIGIEILNASKKIDLKTMLFYFTRSNLKKN